MFRTMEIKEYFDMDPIMYYMNTCTALTDTDTLTNRARHTDFPCKRRILNYGTENIFGNEHTDFCISTELRRSIPLDFVR